MQKPPPLLRLCAGYTLLESLMTLSVVAILAGLGAPAFQSILQNNRMAMARNELTTHLMLARSEAVKRNTGVMMCPSLDGLGCRNSSDWSAGYMIFIDSNRSRKFESGEQVVRYNNKKSTSVRITTSPGRKKVLYNPQGHVFGYNLTFTFCDSVDLNSPRAVIVSDMGRARLSDKGARGTALKCI